MPSCASAFRLADLLVTGTDTGIGKTVVAAALVLALRHRGIRAVGFKPVETGIDPGEVADSEVLRQASGVHEPLAEPLLRLPDPLAPAVASERAGRPLDATAVEVRLRSLREAGYTVVVEGAGGVLVPLAWDYTAADLASRQGLSAVVVARAGLGTLNHVMLTAEALQARGIGLRGVVLNGRHDPPDLAEQTNPAALTRLLASCRLVVLPRRDRSATLALAREFAPSMTTIVEDLLERR